MSGAIGSCSNVVSHTPVETEGLLALQAAYGFVDAVRAIVPPSEKLYTWWSYRGAGLGGVRSRSAARPYLAVARRWPRT